VSTIRRLAACLLVPALIAVVPASGATAATRKIPAWAKQAVNYLDERGYLDRSEIRPNRPMARADFKALMKAAFGGGYRRTKGRVSAGEVDAALVRALGRGPLADALNEARSPDGWSPGVHDRFGSEVVARELGLRYNRPADDDSNEAAEEQKLRQADIAYAVYVALTSPSTYAADELADFSLADYDASRRKVVRFALSLAGAPYVWAGEWRYATPDGYPYGAQEAGGFDCSGFIWYVLHERTESYSPIDRPYRGWSLPERSSAEMAKATRREQRLRYNKLKPGDVVLFAPDGKRSKARDVYHAGLYLGNGWMIHSSGSRAGVSVGSIAPGSWWHDQILWGRRVIRS
jgi:cell wall-associated NlpC family hydrolase